MKTNISRPSFRQIGWHIPLVFLVAMALVPILFATLYSLKSLQSIYGDAGFFSSGFTLDNYREIARQLPIVRITMNTLTVAVLVLICIFGFRTRKIQVSGNVYYGEGTITNWIEKDPLSVNSLYLLGKYTFDKGELPSGVESLKVSLKNPWTVAVTVVEKSMLGYVDYDEAMLYFDEQGIATLRSAKQIEGVPYIEGLSFDTAEVEIGKVLPVEDDAIFEKLAETSRYLRKNALSPERIVCNTDGSDVVLYFGAVEVLLGNEKYEERLAQVGPILEELKKKYPDTAGTLHLENFDSSSASIRFTPQTAEQTADVQ